jgi:hypothetical protein
MRARRAGPVRTFSNRFALRTASPAGRFRRDCTSGWQRAAFPKYCRIHTHSKRIIAPHGHFVNGERGFLRHGCATTLGGDILRPRKACHCEERSDEAISTPRRGDRFARNDRTDSQSHENQWHPRVRRTGRTKIRLWRPSTDASPAVPGFLCCGPPAVAWPS